MTRTVRLHCPVIPDVGVATRLGPDAAAHARVLRLATGQEVELFDGAGGRARATVVALDHQCLVVESLERLEGAVAGPRVSLIQALPKAGKLDGIIRMATELGVSEVHLVTTTRTEVSLDRKRAVSRLDRLERIAREAARQSGRAEVPPVHAPVPLREAAARAPRDATRWVAWENARGAAPPRARRAGEGWVVVGPEGGLDDAEVAPLRQAGWALVGIGTHVLRVETAAPVACALLADRLSTSTDA